MTFNRFVRTSTAAAILALPALSATAADSLDMNVQANVPATCRLVSVPSFNFGDLDQVAAPAITLPTQNVVYRCTNGTAPTGFTVGSSSTSPFLGSLSNGTDTIAYQVAFAAPTTPGTGLAAVGNNINVTLTASMAGGANYNAKSTGLYTQLVPITIAP